MKLYSPCQVCFKKRFFIRKRTYHKPKGLNFSITSQSEMCGRCFRGISRMVEIDKQVQPIDKFTQESHEA